jgi:biopolymer transport protein ExbD
MKGHATVPVLCTAGLSGWIDSAANRIIQSAARRAPSTLSERLEEEWLAASPEQRGPLRRLGFALGCCWAAMAIRREHATVNVSGTCSATGDRTMTACAYRATSSFLRSATPAAPDSVLCEINTTPLIDVMLVLLVTLIISLPTMTHAVRLDLPQAPAAQDKNQPEVIDLDIESDGTVVWNGTPVASTEQLDSYLRAEAQKEPQPEIHLRADRRVKYGFVARVLASAQRNRMKKMGFADTAEFKD